VTDEELKKINIQKANFHGEWNYTILRQTESCYSYIWTGSYQLKTADRGKMIMACGTGKTFTSLKIAEKLVGKGKRVLFLVPGLSLCHNP